MDTVRLEAPFAKLVCEGDGKEYVGGLGLPVRCPLVVHIPVLFDSIVSWHVGLNDTKCVAVVVVVLMSLHQS